mmetsp:Transcript_41603/g.97649  ORF Transcript_41603/g.97649 Transcript_41603/m.97649 type:complete len:382 (-) Transcript_41603:2007-3152(-)
MYPTATAGWRWTRAATGTCATNTASAAAPFRASRAAASSTTSCWPSSAATTAATSAAPGSSRTARSGSMSSSSPRPGSGACSPAAACAATPGRRPWSSRPGWTRPAISTCRPIWAWAWCTPPTWPSPPRPSRPDAGRRRTASPPSCRRCSATGGGRRRPNKQKARWRGLSGQAGGRSVRGRCGGGRHLGLVELSAAVVGHVDHGALDLEIREIAAALRAHIALALERRVQQRLDAALQARAPGGSITKLGRTGGAGGMAGRALGLEDLLAGLHRRDVVGALDLDMRHRRDPLGHRLGVQRARAGRGLGRGTDVIGQHDDDDHRYHEGEQHGPGKLLGGLDRSGVGFVVIVIGAGAHGFLWSILVGVLLAPPLHGAHRADEL